MKKDNLYNYLTLPELFEALDIYKGFHYLTGNFKKEIENIIATINKKAIT